MESLLRWSIENTTPATGPSSPPEPRQSLDPGIIDAILGKPDAVLMKEALAVGMDSTRDPEARVIALDDLEMLVEQIDNAINLKPLQMYPKIISLLSPQTPDPVRMQALWILGTAVQNNPIAQADFLQHDPIPTIISILSPSDASGSQTEKPSGQTRSKAAYALSAALTHNAPAVLQLDEIGGWEVLRDALQDSEITIRRKVAFLINTLLLPTSPPPSSSAAPNISPAGPTIHTAPASAPATSTSTTSTSTPPTVNNVHAGAASPTPALLLDLDVTSTSLLTLKALRTHRIVSALIGSLTTPLPHGPDAEGVDVDHDYAEKAARALVTYLEVGGELTSLEKDQLRPTVVNECSSTRQAWDLGEQEWETLNRSVGSA